MLQRNNVLVLVPAFNEEQTIGSVITELVLENFNVLVIDDGSDDSTIQEAQSHGARVLELPFNLGVGGALRAGFQFAVQNGFEAVVQVDADGQHPVDEIINLVAAANSTNSHLVLGSRFLSSNTSMKVGRLRRFVMWWLAKSASRATGTQITDATSGFRLIRQPLLQEFSRTFAINYLGDTYEALISAGRAGYHITEIPAALRPRQAGESSASLTQAFRFTVKEIVTALLHIHQQISLFEEEK